jgi:serine/threonine-protein kinase
MGLPPGTRLGPYEVVSAIGAGGMGEVYKGRDTRLDRLVAIKVLTEQLAADPQFRERFEREARTISRLDHPHICTLHDVGRENGIDFLVMQYLEGETLAERLIKGPLPVDQAIRHGIEIAEALHKAHRAGIVHRDLKPGNIMLTRAGAKLLDFGLAKAGAPAAAGAGASMLPTTPPGLTDQGTILGTFQYMAPEQLEGGEADARTDIFAFGAMLYEMVTGKRAFEGKSQASLIAAILDREPPAISAVQPLAPSSLDHVVATCLAKEPDARWQSAADLARELTWIAQSGKSSGGEALPAAPARAGSRVTWIVAGLLAGLFLGAAAVVFLARTWTVMDTRAPGEVARVLIGVSPAEQLKTGADVAGDLGHLSRTAIAFSPDGRTLVFTAARGDQQQLYARSLGRLEAVPLTGTDGAVNPFFSPDGAWVGFWANGAIRKVPLAGGAPTTVCESPAVFGATWGSDDVIVFAPVRGGLSKVSAAGGSPTALTTLDEKAGEVSHRLPQLLPDGQVVMFTITRTLFPTWDDTQVVVQSLITGERKVVVEGGADARYVSTGHVIYVRRATLMAVPFSLETLSVTGGAVALVDNVMQAANMGNALRDTGAGQVAIADTGALAYVPGGVFSFPDRSLVWVSRSGRVEALPVPPRAYIYPRLSPDGTRVLFSTQGDRNIWIYDISRGTTTKLTTDGRSLAGLWTPDGTRVTYGASISGTENLFWRPADAVSEAERLATSTNQQRAGAWSADGQTLAYVESSGSNDVLALSRAANGKPSPVVQTRFDEYYPEFSPDGRWLAYASNESGRDEVYVQAYPGPGPKVLVSTDGGTAPAWRRDGRELFYVASSQVAAGAVAMRMMAVPIAATDSLRAGRPQSLFEGGFAVTAQTRGYDLTPDGQRFLMVQPMDRPPIVPNQIVMVQNWFAELMQRVPVN